MTKKNLLTLLLLGGFSLFLFGQQRQVIIPFYDMTTGLFGYKDSVLNMAAIPARYTFADRYMQGRARVERNGKWGFLDHTGKEIVPPTYNEASNMHDSLAAVKRDSLWGFIDREGNEVIEPQYLRVTDFSQERAAVIKDEFWGFIDREGNEVIPCLFGYDDLVRPVFKDSLANVKLRDRWGYISLQGEIVIDFRYDLALPFADSIAAVQRNDRWGFVDRNGTEVIPIQYGIADNTLPVFKDGLLLVNIENLYGYINREGEEVIPLIYDYASNFEGGRAAVRLGSEFFYIDRQGERVE